MRFVINALVFILVGVALGYYSADYAVTHGLSMTTARNGAWTTWPASGSPSADPYTRAHFATSGTLELKQFEALVYRARVDSAGRPLDTSCIYVVRGDPIDTRWWNLAVYGAGNDLIANPARRHSFNSENLIREPDSSFRIVLSREARPGNWIPLGDARSIELVLSLFDPPDASREAPETVPVPRIEREAC